MKMKRCIVIGLLTFMLCACGEQQKETIPDNVTENSVEQESIEQGSSESMELPSAEKETEVEVVTESSIENVQEEPEEQATEVQVNYDIQIMLEEAEAQAADLEKKLYEDASLTQADMNEISNEISTVWDELLNEIWSILNQSLDEETKAELLEEQRAWITEKEAEVKQVGEEAGGSIAALLCNQRAAQLTRTRVYELANYLGYEGTIPSKDSIEEPIEEQIEEIPYQEEETTITFIVEGLEEVVPAITYEGENYSITVPKEGWVDVTSGVWRSDVNNQVQISVVDYTGENINSVRENLSDSGYIETEQNHMSVEDSNGLVWNVRLFTKGEKVVGVFYNYPKEAVEGFGARLSVIVDTFEWK